MTRRVLGARALLSQNVRGGPGRLLAAPHTEETQTATALRCLYIKSSPVIFDYRYVEVGNSDQYIVEDTLS